ncbi:hypothetical protein J18TS1_44670 [Oceanobacillus oncorhynchi subsp. incaldanensis]|uniref:hypothetical protein n=1 Tax=Oceanobacillus TaxID=182709 RepID=UPI001B24B5F6|nr:hypothetical protein [Oceanobacillus oncorhynchi]UUI41303.1 hypothetical protein NP440_07060 [Oceanobacillus oncorhynchi]GIO21367.1 hypothetical protein J18TS1_44670 [Oceanobacillus oncorhynchi subsp. incaldanensis]
MNDKLGFFAIYFFSVAIISLTILYFSGYLSVATGLVDILLTAITGLGIIKLLELEARAKEIKNKKR